MELRPANTESVSEKSSAMKSLLPRALYHASIRTKLTVVLVFVTFTVILASFLLESAWEIRQFREDAKNRSEDVIRIFSHDFTQVLMLDSPHLAVETTSRLHAFDEVTHAYLFDVHGNAIYSYVRKGVDPVPTPDRHFETHIFDDDNLHVWAPVQYENNSYGTVYLRSSLEKSKQDLLVHLGVLGLIVPIVLVVALIMSFASRGLFTRPILRLHDIVRRVGETQDYSLRVEGSEHSEIGKLYRGFNQMLEKIEESNRNIENARVDLKESNRQLSFLATHDPLTGLINRVEFERLLNVVLQRIPISPEKHVLLYLDLDQFKVVNDTCGHAAGNELLRQLTNAMRNQLGPDDVIGRLGGDEFAILLHGYGEREGLAKARALATLIQDYQFIWDDKSLPVAASIGAVSVTTSFADANALLSAADKACYVAKDAGRNRVKIYTENDEHIQLQQGQMQWVSRVRSAMDENRLTLFWQPIVPTRRRANDYRHYELLLRMVERDGSLVTPEMFVPAAERYGLMTRLDRWVVDTVFRGFRDAPDLLDTITVISINISGPSLADENFTRFVSNWFDSSGLAAEKFCFEITETTAITNFTKASEFMMAMKRRGCLFALDDFGSGASSYAYLKRLPVDMIKIDGGFIKDMLDDPIDAAMVKSINDVGHAMGLETIAEFVTNDQIFAKLIELGVDYSQGFALAEPQPLPHGLFAPPAYLRV